MRELKHTPGPWKYDPENDRETLKVRTLSGSPIAEVCDNRTFPLSQCEANARLIAAVPDMYEAIQYAIHTIENTGQVDMARKRLKEAIKSLI